MIVAEAERRLAFGMVARLANRDLLGIGVERERHRLSAKEKGAPMSTLRERPLSIPESAWDAISLPEHPKERELQRELALALYREDLLSFGKARQLAEMSKQAFGALLGERGIARHYGEQELTEDLRFVQAEAKDRGETSSKGGGRRACLKLRSR